MGRENLKIERSDAETIFLIEILAKEIPTIALKETELHYRDESYQNRFRLIWSIRFSLQKTKCFVWQSSNFLPAEKCRLIP